VGGVVDTVCPPADVHSAWVSLKAIVRRVEDVVAEDVDVVRAVRDPISHVRGPVVRHNMAEAVDRVSVQLDPFTVEGFCRVRRVANDRVVGDVSIASALLQIDRIVIVQEGTPADDDARWCVF